MGRAEGSELLAGHRRRPPGAQGRRACEIQEESSTMLTKSARTTVEADGEAVVRTEELELQLQREER